MQTSILMENRLQLLGDRGMDEDGWESGKETFADMLIILIVAMIPWLYTKSKLIELYTCNIYSVLLVIYALIE